MHRGARQHLVERGHVFPAPGGRGGEGDVLVERRVLVARCGLHGGDDLTGDTELGEVAKARLAVGTEVANRLIEADEALLDEVVGVPSGEEVGGGLQPHEAVVAAHEAVVGGAVALLRKGDQKTIINLDLRLRVTVDTCHEQAFLGCQSSPDRSVAHSSPGANDYSESTTWEAKHTKSTTAKA